MSIFLLSLSNKLCCYGILGRELDVVMHLISGWQQLVLFISVTAYVIRRVADATCHV